jgi:isoleucyl-tRNA synthetase
VTELRYLFITSQAEIVATLPADAKYTLNTDSLHIAVVSADGEKCPRCWNYSVKVGVSSEHPALCDRCVGALAGKF